MNYSITKELQNAQEIIQRQFFRLCELERQQETKDKEIQRLKVLAIEKAQENTVLTERVTFLRDMREKAIHRFNDYSQQVVTLQTRCQQAVDRATGLEQRVTEQAREIAFSKSPINFQSVIDDQQRRIAVLQRKLEVERDFYCRSKKASDARGVETAELKQKLETRDQEIAKLNSRPQFEGTAMRQQEIIAELQIKNQSHQQEIADLQLVLQIVKESRDKWRARAHYRAQSEPNRLALMLAEDKARKEQQLRQQYSPLPVTLETWARNCDTQKASEGHKSPLC